MKAFHYICRMIRSLFLILCALTLGSCSLFRFSVDTGGTPLPGRDLSIRTMTRAFGAEFISRVARAADSIAEGSADPAIRIEALRWKMNATAACASAVYQSVPEVALLNTWVLCRQMQHYMAATPDSLLLGPRSGIARTVSDELLSQMDTLAAGLLAPDRLAEMAEFTEKYAAAHPVQQMRFAAPDLMLAWVRHLGISDQDYVKTVGSVQEVIADMGDRMSGAARQFGDRVDWTADLIALRMEQDSIRDRLSMQLDSLAGDCSRMVLILEHSPQLADPLAAGFNARIAELIATLDGSMAHAFAAIDRQRTELQRFVDAQREVLMQEARQTARDTVQNVLDGLPGLVGSVLLYLVLALAVLFGVPFALGFLLGRARTRRDTRRKKDD